MPFFMNWLRIIRPMIGGKPYGNPYLTRSIAMVWVSTLTIVYLRMRDAPSKDQTDVRSTFDIIMAFLGSYGQAKRLQANVRDWEGRYRMVVENTNDLIMLVAEPGAILDVNTRVIETLGYSMYELSGINIRSIMNDMGGNACEWKQVWQTLFPQGALSDSKAGMNIVGQELLMRTQDGKLLTFDTTITPLTIQKSHASLVVARDITSRTELEREREALQSQLVHSQRMEAVGQLAGGIAHDFNNLLHAIQGSLDMLDTIKLNNKKAKDLCSNITMAVKRASTLTGQLLGFARAGKYKVERIDVEELIYQTEGLFRPLLGKKVDLKVVIHPDPMAVEGDFTQLEQVLLNILINAMAALDGEDGTIIFRVEPRNKYTPGWQEHYRALEAEKNLPSDQNGLKEEGISTETPPNEKIALSDSYVVFRIRDNGCGMDQATKRTDFSNRFSRRRNKRALGWGWQWSMVVWKTIMVGFT